MAISIAFFYDYTLSSLQVNSIVLIFPVFSLGIHQQSNTSALAESLKVLRFKKPAGIFPAGFR